MDPAYYKNLTMTVFGERVTGKTPSQILHLFRNESPIFRNEPIGEYIRFMIAANGAPEMESGESFEAWSVRVLDHLIHEGIAKFDGH